MMADASDHGLCVTIRDQGPGMPEEMADLLRSKGVAPLPRGGRGLGLWTVARLLERTGGDVEVVVTAGGGTDVTAGGGTDGPGGGGRAGTAGGGTDVTIFIPFLKGRRGNAAA
jgi:signal transduction histidine kinase